jgi:NADPH:quinone reductase-like Zn-dependent oxidoreductase
VRDLVRSLGADHVLDHARDDFADGRRRYDVILDIGGNPSLSRLRRALTPRGTLVIVGGETGGRWIGGYDRQLRAAALSPFVGQRLRTFVAAERAADMTTLVELIAEGRVRPVVDRRFPLEEAAKAIRYVEDGHARGKVVITVRPGE